MLSSAACKSRVLALAIAPVLGTAFGPTTALAQVDPPEPLNLPPLNGFQPLVIFGMTDEQYPDDTFELEAFFTHAGSTPGGNGVPSQTLPAGSAQKYFVA